MTYLTRLLAFEDFSDDGLEELVQVRQSHEVHVGVKGFSCKGVGTEDNVWVI